MAEVEIEEAEGTLSGGFIPWLKEKYPFSKLTPAEWANTEKTAVKGPSFVIKKADNPPSVLAAGRKRFNHCTYISRKINPEGDVRVWLHPDSPLPADKPATGAKVVTPKQKKTPAPQRTPANASGPKQTEAKAASKE